MSLEFLFTTDAGAPAGSGTAPLARSPMERVAVAAGGRTETRDGWSVVTGYGAANQEAQACRETAAFIDQSHLGKLEVQAAEGDLGEIVAAVADGATVRLGHATHAAGAWWCPLTPTRLLVVSDGATHAALRARLEEVAGRAAARVSVTDVTSVFAALNLVGPGVREVFARFCALDLRPHVTPVTGLRPGSVARQPGIVLREGEDRYLYLFGSAVGEYVWTVVADAAQHLGGRPAGVDAIAPLGELRGVALQEASRA
jgi:sarcosine oxidase subunit alpha